MDLNESDDERQLYDVLLDHGESNMDLPEVDLNAAYGTRIPDDLAEVIDLSITDAPTDGFPERVKYYKLEIDMLPLPDDLDNESCGVCYGCITAKSCVNPNQELHDIYVEWYDRLQVEIWEFEREAYRLLANTRYRFEDDYTETTSSTAHESSHPWLLVNGRQDSLGAIFSN